MVLYKKKSSSIFRYLLAIIVLTLGLTLTVVDVYGLQLPFGQNGTDSYNNYLNQKELSTDDAARDSVVIDTQDDSGSFPDQESDSVPTSVPEPSTIILLASGLGLFRLAHKKK